MQNSAVSVSASASGAAGGGNDMRVAPIRSAVVRCSESASAASLPSDQAGPISVLPTYQRQGTGHALMHAIIAAAEAAGEALIALLGDPHFYRRFGFVEASRLGVAAPDPGWGPHFQVRTLTDSRTPVTGTFRYAAPFADL